MQGSSLLQLLHDFDIAPVIGSAKCQQAFEYFATQQLDVI